MYKPDLLEKIERMTAIGIDLSVEKDHDRLLETILKGAKEIAGADAGTLYLLKDDNCLHFTIVLADSLNISMGGTSGNPVTLDAVPLYDEQGQPNRKNVVSYAASRTGRSISRMPTPASSMILAGRASLTRRTVIAPSRSSVCRCAITRTS